MKYKVNNLIYTNFKPKMNKLNKIPKLNRKNKNIIKEKKILN